MPADPSLSPSPSKPPSQPPHRLPNPGSAFDCESGKLYRFSRCDHFIQQGTIEVIRPWPDPRAWIKELFADLDECELIADRQPLQTRGWRGNQPLLSLDAVADHGPRTEEDSRTFDARWKNNHGLALARIPDEVRAAVCQFHPRYHWRVLNLLARAPGLIERAESQPLLLLALAHARYFKERSIRKPHRAARALCGRRSTEILRWLDWPAPRSSLRLLRKLVPRQVRLADLHRLRRLVLANEKWVNHLPRLNRSVLLLLEYHRPVVSSRFVSDVCQLDEPRSQARSLRTLRRVRQNHELEPGRRSFPKVRSLAHLEDLGQRDRARQGRGGPDWWADGSMTPIITVPTPPFPEGGEAEGSALSVRPLCSPAEIVAHSRKMRNCLAVSPTHLRPIAAGRAAVYEVVWEGAEQQPSASATAFVEQQDPGQWELTEIALAENGRCPDWLTQKVWNWVARQSGQPARALGSLPEGEQRASYDPDQLWMPF